MEQNISSWNGFPVIGDAKALDYIVESDGMIRIDKNDILKTLSLSGKNYITAASGTNIAEAFNEAVANLPLPLGKIERILIQFYIGNRQPNMSDFSEINTMLGKAESKLSVKWGFCRNESVGDNFKVVLLSSVIIIAQ